MPAPYFSKSFPLKGGNSAKLVVVDSVGLEGALVEDRGKEIRMGRQMSEHFTGREAGEKQWRWLEAQLADPRPQWLLVAGHKPVVSSCDRDRFRGDKLVQQKLEELMSRYPVDVYMHGHDHSAQHTVHRGTHHIGNGIGGFGLHRVMAPEQRHAGLQ
eukprot:gene3783-4733_t